MISGFVQAKIPIIYKHKYRGITGEFIYGLGVFFILLLSLPIDLLGQQPLKREFRGVWIASVANIDWPSRPDLTTEQQRDEFRKILNYHKQNGMNAVVVQIRPAADALYRSSYEPWSEWLTGRSGKIPEPEYDPLTFMVEEAHERCMEFHAWLNPYRAIFDAESFYRDSTHMQLDTLKQLMQDLMIEHATADLDALTRKQYIDLASMLELDTGLMIYKHPDWFLQYGNKIYFDPGIPEVRDHISEVVADIVRRYDVDAIHMDDYFYPYKIAGLEFPDSLSFQIFGQGFDETNKDDWRRENVNLIVRSLQETILSVDPRVKFGISPFGVWRNAADDPRGSQTTAGQTNYDHLYADVLLWLQEKWIDYVVPQIYWHRGFELADYEVLARWWNDHSHGAHVYIGQGIYRIDANSNTAAWRDPEEIPAQIELNRGLPNIRGSCFFSSRSMINNPLDVTYELRNMFYANPAFVPVPQRLALTNNSKPRIVSAKSTVNGILLDIENPAENRYIVVYRFRGRRIKDVTDSRNIVSVLNKNTPLFEDTNVKRFRKYTYAVSGMDRSSNESDCGQPTVIRWKKPKRR